MKNVISLNAPDALDSYRAHARVIDPVAPYCLQRKTEMGYIASVIERFGVKTVLEIGTYFGGTATLYASLGCEVVTVDVYNNAPKVWEMFPELLSGGPLPEFVLGDSHRPAIRDFLRSRHDLYDLVVIDGDHSLEGGYRDWIDYSRMGRVVMVHDIEQPDDVGLVERWPNWFPTSLWRILKRHGLLWPCELEQYSDAIKGNWGTVVMGGVNHWVAEVDWIALHQEML